MRGKGAGVLFAVGLLVVGGALVPSGTLGSSATGPRPTAGTSSLYIAATGDYDYTPDTFEEVPTNTTITVTFVDNSTMFDGHSFTIIGEEGVQIPSTASQAEIDQLAWGNDPPALLDLNVSALGDRNVSSFRSPGPGWYEFVCTLPSHFQLGMYGFIAFGEKLPSNLTLPHRQGLGSAPLGFSAVDAVVVSVAGLLILAIAYYVHRLRRSTMPSAPPARPPAAEGAGAPLRDDREGRGRGKG